ERRGKYLWLPLGDGTPGGGEPPAAEREGEAAEALLAHLGMSGQLLVVDPLAPIEKHLRARLSFTDGAPELRFVDQRTFGHLLVAPMAARVPRPVPVPITHIASDPVEDAFDDEVFAARLRLRRTELKRALLDQSLISGVGNIYADEALWRARLHWARA